MNNLPKNSSTHIKLILFIITTFNSNAKPRTMLKKYRIIIRPIVCNVITRYSDDHHYSHNIYWHIPWFQSKNCKKQYYSKIEYWLLFQLDSNTHIYALFHAGILQWHSEIVISRVVKLTMSTVVIGNIKYRKEKKFNSIPELRLWKKTRNECSLLNNDNLP